MANVIEIRDLSKTYTGFKLDNLSLDLEEVRLSDWSGQTVRVRAPPSS